MQTKNTKNSNFFERIMQIADFYGYKNTNDFAKNALKYKSPEKINRLKDPTKKPSVDIILDITNKFEKINIKWLLTGRGKMIEEDSSDIINVRKSIPTDNNQTILEMLIKLSGENALLKEEISRLKRNKPLNYDYAAEPEPDEI